MWSFSSASNAADTCDLSLTTVCRATLRFLLLKVARRPLLLPPIPERDIDPATLPPTTAETEASKQGQNDPAGSMPFHLRNNHISFDEPSPLLLIPPPPKTSSSPIDDYLLPKALSPASVQPSVYLIKPLASLNEWLAEGLYILRPLIYGTYLIASRGTGINWLTVVMLSNSEESSSRPIVVSIVMELVTSYLRRRPAPSHTLERTEYARRDRALLWYLFRGAIWKDFTR